MHIVSQFDRWFYLFILNKKNNFSTYVLKILNKHNKVSQIDIKKFFLSDLIGRFLRFDIPSRSYTILHISVTSFVRDRIVKHTVSELKGPESPCDRSEHIYIERKNSGHKSSSGWNELLSPSRKIELDHFLHSQNEIAQLLFVSFLYPRFRTSILSILW